MRLELQGAEATTVDPGRRAPRARRRRRDPYEFVLLGIFVVLSFWTLAVVAWQVFHNGRIWTGTDGIYLGDQQQYVAWIRSATHHFLINNTFVLRHTPADYFQPAVIISAGLTVLGVAPWLALLIWKPVAVLATFFAFRAYVHRSLPGLFGRRVALTLALFFGSFSIVYGAFSVLGDVMPVFLSWGYTFGLLSIALQAFALVAYERARREGRVSPLAGVTAAVAGLLHPWQAEVFVVLIVATEAVMWLFERRRPPFRLIAVTLALTGLTLLYYLILGRTDESWKLARDASKHGFSLWTILMAIGPLLIPALFGWWPRRREFMDILSRVWLASAFVVWLVSASSVSATPLHAFEAITLPLSVLAVEGAARLRLDRLPHARQVAVAVLLILTVPATIKLMLLQRDLASPTPGNANFITPSEREALHYLAENPNPGGVLTRFYLGTIIPAKTDRQTFVGDCLWSEPGCTWRAVQVQQLFSGVMNPDVAQAFVHASGARFLLSDCGANADLSHVLAPLLGSVRRFGCATVYEVAAPTAPTGPLAESGGDAALRASRRQQRPGQRRRIDSQRHGRADAGTDVPQPA